VYKTEAMFSRALCDMLANKPVMVQRIESGETGRGIPDLYLRLKKREVWIELKNHKDQSIHQRVWFVRWRRGQQAWATKYRQSSGLCTFTLVAMKDGYLWIPMLTRYIKNKVILNTYIQRGTALHDVWTILQSL